MKDWPDPRFPDHKASRIEIVIVSILVVLPIIFGLFHQLT